MQRIIFLTVLALALTLAPRTCPAQATPDNATQPRPGAIAATDALDDTHPEIEAGMSCNDCHEIAIDAGTTATQIWLTGDYLNWKAGEGIMPKEKVWARIVEIFKAKGMKRTFVAATSCNNRPYTFTADYALDPTAQVLYGFHEIGTEKMLHMRANPAVSLNWHREFQDDFNDLACFQVIGRADIFTGKDPEFEAGLNVYPYAYAARQRNLTLEQWRDIIRKSMVMTRITIDRIRLTEGALRKSNYRTSQEWTR